MAHGDLNLLSAFLAVAEERSFPIELAHKEPAANSGISLLYDTPRRRGVSAATATINSSGSMGFTRCI